MNIFSSFQPLLLLTQPWLDERGTTTQLVMGPKGEAYCHVQRVDKEQFLSIDQLRSPVAQFVPQEFVARLVQSVLDQLHEVSDENPRVFLPRYAFLCTSSGIQVLPKMIAAGKKGAYEYFIRRTFNPFEGKSLKEAKRSFETKRIPEGRRNAGDKRFELFEKDKSGKRYIDKCNGRHYRLDAGNPGKVDPKTGKIKGLEPPHIDVFYNKGKPHVRENPMNRVVWKLDDRAERTGQTREYAIEKVKLPLAPDKKLPEAERERL